MTHVLFNKEGKGYNYKNSDSIEMCILGIFLSSSVCLRASSFREWLFRSEEVLSSNTTLLEKEDDTIILSDLYDEYPPDHYLQLTREQFLYILDMWEKLYKEGPEEIVIIKDKNVITMTGINKLN